MSSTNILVAFFSHAGENYGVGNVKKGNTQCLAEIIAAKTGADLFEIKRAEPYPIGYDEVANVAKKENENDARPPIAEDLSNIQNYDTIFLGYPAWYHDAPMPVYTFLEKHDLSGKTIIPFLTHEGSGMIGDKHIAKVCPKSIMKPGLAVIGTTAQKNHTKTEKAVDAFLKKLNMK